MIQIWQRNFAAIGKSEQRGGDLRWLPDRKEGDIFQLQRGVSFRGGWEDFLSKPKV